MRWLWAIVVGAAVLVVAPIFLAVWGVVLGGCGLVLWLAEWWYDGARQTRHL